ncbi:MAG TPA: hypothetical protein VN783_15345, partial [Thermoanaerobaculia bacterium]|nr:hypothetical protein [Thermoanaerobaculia bacterium]
RELSSRDRALLVDFDSAPHLLARPTRDLGAIASALEGLHADGGTALWSAVVFGLDHLAGVSGRKALIVYSDGIGEEDPTPFRDCLAAARRRGVPIYLILSTTESARRARSLLSEPIGEKLDRLARATGGAAFFLTSDDDLDALYARILAELRSQYLLTFYPPEGSPEAWQDLEVEVLRPGLTARAYSGFLPRSPRSR